MSGETKITVIGNLTGDPELRFTPSGAAVANFTVASTPRTWDKQAGEFKDGESLFMRCSVWRQQAEHVAESLVKGDRVAVTGNLVQRQYEDREGNKRTVYEVQAEEVAASLLFRSFTHQSGRSRAAMNQGGGRQQEAAADPWASQGSSYGDEPPF